jgi:hypothetical protein
MKNASYHDDKMEAYCNVVRVVEDKFYGIELNHVPHRYNKEADELAKIASGRITVPLNIFARDVTKPSVNPQADTLEPKGTLGGSLEPSGRRACGRGPLERGIRALLASGVWRGRG